MSLWTDTTNPEVNMPNWCNNYLSVSGPYDEVKRFFDEVKEKPSEDKDPNNLQALTFENHAPLKEDPDDSWVVSEYWGTKWDACSVDVHSEDVIKLEGDQGEIQYSFQTAWSPPSGWFSVMVPQFPTLVFRLDYEECGNGVYGYLEGSGGQSDDTTLEHEEWVEENYEAYGEIKDEIAGMSQEDLIKFFSPIKSFEECCWGGEDWPEALGEDQDWNHVEGMDEFQSLAGHIVSKIETKNLPHFINVDWGYSYNQQFKERLKRG
jgi:hypothetical protein